MSFFLRLTQTEDPGDPSLRPKEFGAHAVWAILSELERGVIGKIAARNRGGNMFGLTGTEQTRWNHIIDEVIAWGTSGGHPCGFHPLPVGDPGRLGYPSRHVFDNMQHAQQGARSRAQVKASLNWSGGD